MSRRFNAELLKKTDDDNGKPIKVPGTKKYNATKRAIQSICAKLSLETFEYKPTLSVEAIRHYVRRNDIMPRILYSEVSNHLFNLNQEERSVFLTNVENLLVYTLDNPDVDTDVSRIVIKLYDHTQLVNYQIESINSTFVDRISDAKVDLHDEIKAIEKNHVTILGIFASIVVAFVGSLAFSTSILSNVCDTNIFYLMGITLVIGLIFFNLLYLLIDFLRDINEMPREDGRRSVVEKYRRGINIAMCIMIIISLLAYGVSQNKFVIEVKHDSKTSVCKTEVLF